MGTSVRRTRLDGFDGRRRIRRRDAGNRRRVPRRVARVHLHAALREALPLFFLFVRVRGGVAALGDGLHGRPRAVMTRHATRLLMMMTSRPRLLRFMAATYRIGGGSAKRTTTRAPRRTSRRFGRRIARSRENLRRGATPRGSRCEAWRRARRRRRRARRRRRRARRRRMPAPIYSRLALFEKIRRPTTTTAGSRDARCRVAGALDERRAVAAGSVNGRSRDVRALRCEGDVASVDVNIVVNIKSLSSEISRRARFVSSSPTTRASRRTPCRSVAAGAGRCPRRRSSSA